MFCLNLFNFYVSLNVIGPISCNCESLSLELFTFLLFEHYYILCIAYNYFMF